MTKKAALALKKDIIKNMGNASWYVVRKSVDGPGFEVFDKENWVVMQNAEDKY